MGGRVDSHTLLIDDDPRHASALDAAVTAAAGDLSRVEWVRTLADGLDRLNGETPQAVFLNLSLPDSQRVETFANLVAVASRCPVVVFGGADDEDICRAALLDGAYDYLLEGHLDVDAFSRVLRNIREREIARHELFVEKERAQVTLNSIGDAVLSTDNSGNVTYMNPVAEQMTGWSAGEAIGRRLSDVFQIIDRVTRRPAIDPLELAIRLDKPVGLSANCLLVRRDGAEAPIEDTAAPIHDRDGQITGAVIVFHDVAMARSRVLEMSHRAQHDVLTDLPNRLLLMDRLNQAIVRATRHRGQLAVMFLDIDGFKRINDSFGHVVGDRLLVSVAASLSACVRKSDTVSRHGGDEFLILLPELLHATDATISATKILAELKKPRQIDGHLVHMTASIGLSTYPQDGQDAEVLIRNADAAMYQAKHENGDTFRVFRSEIKLDTAAPSPTRRGSLPQPSSRTSVSRRVH